MTMNFVKASAVSGSPLNPTAIWDGGYNDTTSPATLTATHNATLGTTAISWDVYGFPNLPVLAYTSKTVKFNLSISNYVDGTGEQPSMSVFLSLDGGSTFPTDMVDLPPSLNSLANYIWIIPKAQDLTLVRLRFTTTVYGNGSAGSTVTAKLFDAWIEGTYGSAGKKDAGFLV
jgi:hypothetical protein